MTNLEALLALFPSLLDLEGEFYLVGGAVRDTLLNRPVHDLDFAVQGEARKAARRFAHASGGSFYTLDEERDTARVLLEMEGQHWNFDFAGLRSEDLEGDLRGRDFTINAMAVDVRQPDALFDPCGGLEDTRAGILRACSPTAFLDDPVRILRAARLSLSLKFRIDPQTSAWLKSAVPYLNRTSPERLRDELFLMLESPKAFSAIQLLDMLDVLELIFPEIEKLKQLPQSAPHVANGWNHTLATIQKLGELWAALVSPYNEDTANSLMVGLAVMRLGRFREGLRSHFNQPLTPMRSRRGILVLAALLHDIAKPISASVGANGVHHFYGHDQHGAKMAAEIATHLALSKPEVDYLRTLIGGHMRIHFLAKDSEISKRAIYRYFRSMGNVGIDLTLLSLADTMATYGTTLTPEIWQAELDVCRSLLEAWFEQESEIVHPVKVIDGTILMKEFGLAPGPKLGALISAIEEAQAAGEVTSLDEGLAFARRLLVEIRESEE